MLNAASTGLPYGEGRMVDYFSLALSHGLIALALVRLLLRPDLDRDPLPETDGPETDKVDEVEPADPVSSGVPRLNRPVRRA